MKKLISFALVVIMIASLFTLCVSFVFAEGEYDAEVLNADGNKVKDLNLSELSDFEHARNAVADGQTIRLLKDVERPDVTFIVGDVTLDGNGYTLTYKGTDKMFSVATATQVSDDNHPDVFKTVTIKNLKAVSSGSIMTPYFVNVVLEDGNDMTGSSTMFRCTRTNGAKLTVNGGKYTTSGNFAIFGLDEKSYEVDIRGGSFSSTNAPIIQMKKAGTVNISGGKFRLSGDNVIINMLADAPGNLNVNIYDGYFYSTSFNRIAAVLAGTMNVYGKNIYDYHSKSRIYIDLINATAGTTVFIRSEAETEICMKITDCRGENVENNKVVLRSGMNEFCIPISGFMNIKKI